MKQKNPTFDPSLRRGPKAVSKPSSSTTQPRPSSAQPQISKSRSTNYDRPWMSASKNLSKTLPRSNSTRSNSSSAMTRTVDLTVSSNQHEIKRKMNENIMKDKNAKKIVDKISNEASTQIIKVAGKRQISDMENEEIKLKFDKNFKEHEKTENNFNATEQLERHRQKKTNANQARAKAVHNITTQTKPKPHYNVAEEVPVPKEYPKAENPFDLQIEGIELTAEQKREAARVKDQKTENLKLNMDRMINKLSTASTTQKINDFLQNDYSSVRSAPLSHRSYISVSGLETREWKFSDLN